MDWSDEGMVIAARRHGESAAIVTLLTRTHGRHLGLARGGAGRHGRGLYQPGNTVAATWRARLAEHLGSWSCEPLRANGAALLDRAGALAALAAACALIDAVLPEREPHEALYDSTLALVASLAAPGWAESYVRWELDLLAELGFGLDLASCAATGANDGLAYVSPRTGRAVSAAAGEPFSDRLLALPAFLAGPEGGRPRPDDIAAGLDLTGFFLTRCVFAPDARKLPAARTRLVDAIARNPTISSVTSEL
jgi:DNA repair protein RecO (recombination protein O)